MSDYSDRGKNSNCEKIDIAHSTFSILSLVSALIQCNGEAISDRAAPGIQQTVPFYGKDKKKKTRLEVFKNMKKMVWDEKSQQK